MSYISQLPANFAWWYERDRIGIIEWAKGRSIDSATSPNLGAGLKLGLFVTRRAGDFGSSLSEVSEIPPQFHEALAYKVIADGYLNPKNLNPQLATHFQQMYLGQVKKGKKYGRSRHVTTGRIVPQDF